MQPGDYSSTVTILSGAAPPQFVQVTATVRMDQSNVVASITPNPVVQNSAQWSFQIRLQETAGAVHPRHCLEVQRRGRVGQYRRVGSARIASRPAAPSWPRCSGAGVFPHGDQYFEFWGVDEASGQPWYRVATVTFQ